MLVVSSCCLSKTCASASPVPPYTAYQPQATERSAAAGVLNEEARFESSSSSPGSGPTIANRDQLITDERPASTIPQAKQQQHQEEEGYTNVMPSSNDMGIGPGPAIVEPSALPQPAEVLAPMGSCDWVVLKAMASLVAGGASATGGTALQAEATITSDVVGTFSTVTGDVATGVRPSLVPRGGEKGPGGPWDFPPPPGPPPPPGLPFPPGPPFHPGPPPHDSSPPTSGPSPSTSSPSPSISSPPPTTSSPSSFSPSNIALVSYNGMEMPPAVMLWMQCIWVAANVLWVVISKVWSQVSHCAAISKVRSWVSQRASSRVHNEQPDRQDGEDKGDTPEYDESIASSTTVICSVDKYPKSPPSLSCKLKQMLS
ncbi:hypothetical protein EDB85DRAFT_2147041 [Lactarius pseudohatsudake]|nr:hypothetical protein EDB85DRAFT_2147041 [Lactarius pseudohatsudake]